MDKKHLEELEKNKIKNRWKRLQEGLPLPYPLAIALELSNNCNSNCYMCPRKDLTRPIGDMEFNLFKKIIDELSDNKIKLRKLFLHWLGEPLLNENFDKMIAYAEEKDIADIVVMASNIIALDKEKSIRLIESGLDELFVSLDAINPKTYDKIKGNSEDLKIIETNLCRLIELREEMNSELPYIRLKFLKNELNKNDEADFKKKWEPIVDEVYIEEELNTWNGNNETVNNSVTSDEIYKENTKEKEERWPCDRLWYQMAISVDGKVTPCIADWDGVGFIGDVNKDSIFNIWNCDALVEMRRKQLDGDYENLSMCRDCNRWIFRHMKDWLINNREKALAIRKKS